MNKKVLLVCERSGGHIFPALSIGKKLKREGKEVHFFVTSDFLKNYVEREGFPTIGRGFPSRNLFVESLWRFFEALGIILTLRPKKVIGFGGRDSFFLVLISSFLFRDTVIYEPNVKPGKANKVLVFFTRKILFGFETGIPMRDNIKKIDKTRARKILGFDERPVVFCFGGSQGSAFINRAFMRFVHSVKEDYQIIHLTGKEDYPNILESYRGVENNKFIKDFHYEMELLYSAADVIISRAGASALGEISYYGLPSVLIPHPAAGGHQRENAFYFKNRGAAFVHLQSDFSFENFKSLLERLICDNDLRESVKEKARGIKLGVSFEDFCGSSYF